MHKTYRWTGINQKGEQQSGTMIGLNTQHITEQLKNQHITSTSIKKKYSFKLQQKPRIKKSSINQFTHQLLTLIQANIPLMQALSIIKQGINHSEFNLLLTNIIKRINDGLSLSDALAKHPKHFNSLYCAFISTGEATGKLALNLKSLYNHRQQQAAIRQQFIKAISYPSTVLILSLTLCLGLFIFVIPQFSDVYTKSGKSLPQLTQTLINLSIFIQQKGALSTALLALSTAGYYGLIRYSNKLSQLTSQASLHIPFAGQLIKQGLTAKWATLLGCCQNSGIPLDQALNYAQQSIEHKAFKIGLNQLNQHVTSGQALHSAMENSQLFDTTTIHMITIGEKSGQLSAMLHAVAKQQTQQLENRLNGLSKWLEPVMMMVLAGILGTVIIGMYLPIFNIGSVI